MDQQFKQQMEVSDNNARSCLHIYVCITLIDGDYINKMQDITFSPGDQLKRVNVTIIDDNIFENLEEFSAQLTTLDGRVIIAESDAVVQIVDDDNGNS